MADKDFKVKQGLDLGVPLPVSEGGTGQTTAGNALNSLLPVQSSQSGKILETDGTNVAWVTKPAEYQRGNTASRPTNPTVGDIYVNTETAFIEIYTGTTYGWEQVGGIASTVSGVTATNQGTSRPFNNGQASIAFTPGTILGRTYLATSNPGGFTTTGSSSPLIITGLQSSTQYTYTVAATNNYGTSAASAASAGVTATTVPQAPSIGTVTISNDVATIPFTANATGGAAITSYTATSNPGGITGTSSSSPITISSLTNNETYTFTVTGTNSNGTSLPSAASNAVTVLLDAGAYFPLGEFTLASAQTSVTFNNIPQTYTHLQIRANIGKTSAGNNQIISIRFNNDSSANYKTHLLFGDGAAAGANEFNNISPANTAGVLAYRADNSVNTFTGVVADFLDYKNTNKNKTMRSLWGFDTNGTANSVPQFGLVGLQSTAWFNTAAISRIDIIGFNSNTFPANSHFALYGVLA